MCSVPDDGMTVESCWKILFALYLSITYRHKILACSRESYALNTKKH